MGYFAEACVRCGRYIFVAPSNAAGRDKTGRHIKGEGTVCVRCLDAEDKKENKS